MIVDVVKECVLKLEENFPFVFGNPYLANVEADQLPLAFSFLDDDIGIRHNFLATGRIETFYRLKMLLALKTEFSESSSSELVKLKPKLVMEELMYHQKKLFQLIAEHPNVNTSAIKQGNGSMGYNQFDANFMVIALVMEVSLKDDGFTYCPPTEPIRRRIFSFQFANPFE